MPAQARIAIDPKVMLGKPVVRGTRITVELILRKLAEGATQQDPLEAYPHLTVDDVRAAISYAADMIAHEETVQASWASRTMIWSDSVIWGSLTLQSFAPGAGSVLTMAFNDDS